MARIIVCVGMDAFFASVEQQDNPAVTGKIIGVAVHIYRPTTPVQAFSFLRRSL